MSEQKIDWAEFDDEELRCRYVIDSGLHLDDNFPWPIGHGDNALLFRAIFGEGPDDLAREAAGHLVEQDKSSSPDKALKSGVDKLRDTSNKHDSEEWITPNQAINAINGMAYANEKFGLVFNTHITITYRYGGVKNEKQATRIFSRFTNEMSKWMGRQNLMNKGYPMREFWNECVFLYVHEESKGKGFHTHLLTHVPLKIKDAFSKWALRRLSKLMPGPIQPELLKISHTYGRSDWRALVGQKRLMTYILKGTDPTVVEMESNKLLIDVLEIPNKWRRPAGKIIVEKRVGLSRNISRAARDKAGFLSCFEKKEDHRIYSGDELAKFEERVNRPSELKL